MPTATYCVLKDMSCRSREVLIALRVGFMEIWSKNVSFRPGRVCFYVHEGSGFSLNFNRTDIDAEFEPSEFFGLDLW